MDKQLRYLETPPDWTADERPVLPGSPPSIAHSSGKRYLYFFIGTFIALSAGLSNGFITANLPQLQGEYGLTPITQLKEHHYDAVILAVAHDEFKNMSIDDFRALAKENYVLYDLKYILDAKESDLRL